MSIVVGYGPEARGGASLDLGRALAESTGLRLVVVCIIPDRWGAVSPARAADGAFQAHLRATAKDSLEAAHGHLAHTTAPVEYHVRSARSAPAGLLEAAKSFDAEVLVTGSSAAGQWGHIALGSVTDRLLHSSEVPVALSPRGHHAGVGERITRVTVAHDGTPGSERMLRRADEVAQRTGAEVRVVTFAVRPGQMLPSEVGLRAEDDVAGVGLRAARDRLDRAVECLGHPVEVVVADGRTWAQALDVPGWHPGDLLVVGSSSSQPLLSRVFLGSTAARIVRHSPVPVLVVP